MVENYIGYIVMDLAGKTDLLVTCQTLKLLVHNVDLFSTIIHLKNIFKRFMPVKHYSKDSVLCFSVIFLLIESDVFLQRFVGRGSCPLYICIYNVLGVIINLSKHKN